MCDPEEDKQSKLHSCPRCIRPKDEKIMLRYDPTDHDSWWYCPNCFTTYDVSKTPPLQVVY